MGACFVSNQLTNTEGGEDVSKTTTFASYIPQLPQHAGTIVFDRPAYPCDGDLALTVVDTGLTMDTPVTVSTSGGDLEIVLLSAIAQGYYHGSIPIAEQMASTGNGILDVAPAVTITVSYLDADNGTGNSALVEAQAPLDCPPPHDHECGRN